MAKRAGSTAALATAVLIALEPRMLLAATPAPPTLWTTQGPGGGGSYFAAALDGDRLFVASDMSGIYRSADFGQSWQQLNFHNSASGGINGGTPSQVAFTSDPNVLYIPYSNVGVAKSTNGGTTWNKLTAWGNGTAYWAAAEPTSTIKLLVANANNLYVSSNGGSSFATAYASSGLYVAGALFDGSNVYVGTNKGLLVSSNGGASFALASAQPPAGQYMISFTGAKEGATTRLMAVTSTTNPNATNSNGTSARSYAFSKLYRLDYGGSWVDKTAAALAVDSGEKPRFVQMARNNISVTYLGGADAAGRPDVLKTINGGDNWADVFFTRTTDGGGIPNKNTNTAYSGQGGDFDWSWGGTPWTFVVSRDDANRVMFANSGFVHVTHDGGASWHQADVNPADENAAGANTPQHKPYRTSGADDTSVHYLTWTSPTNIMAGYTDTTGWRSTDGGSSWAYPTWNGFADNTVYKVERSADGTKLYGAASSIHDMYQSNYLLDTRTNSSIQNGRVIVSADQGATWSLIHEFGHPVVWEQLDPNNANRMYAMVVDGIASSDGGAAGGVWVTNNLSLGASSTWTKLTNPPRTQGHAYILRVLNDGTLVATYSGRRFDDGTGEKFTDSSGVFVSTDGGNTWADRSAANMHWYTKEVVIDPTDANQNTWYAAVANGWSGTGNDLGDLYRTTNRGVSWTKLGLQNVVGAISLDVNSVTINAATKEMYVATGTKGVLYTPDVTVANLTWSNFSDVTSFPHAWVERVFINPYDSKDVWVATFGGGIKRGGVGPAGLTASAVSGTQINLSWTDNSSNESGFEIDRATDLNFTQNLVTSGAPANATAAPITGLSAGTTYYFRVRAVGGPNKSANSSTASAATAVAFDGTSGNDAWYVRRNGTLLEVFNSPTPVGSPLYSAPFATVPSLTFNAGGGDDVVTLDGGSGDPIPSGGVFYDGGAGANALSIVGATTAAAGVVTLEGGNVTLTATNAAAAGNVDFSVLASASLRMTSSLRLASLNLTGGGMASLDAGGEKLLRLGTSMLVGTPSALDLADNAMIVDGDGDAAVATQLVASGRNGGAWNGPGIVTSMPAAITPNQLMSLGVAAASKVLGITDSQTGVWHGETVTGSDALVMFTYAGDANLDGQINIDDYGHIDTSVGVGLSGWFNGDFNLDGKVNIDDYGIIDVNVGTQGPPMGTAPAAASLAWVTKPTVAWTRSDEPRETEPELLDALE